MAAPTVVIELPAGDRALPLAETLVRACSGAVAEGRCVLASDREEENVAAVAIVTWADGERRVASVSGGLRAAVRLGSLPAFARIGGGYGGAPSAAHGLSLRWATLSAGVGVLANLGALPLRVEATADAVAQLVLASATDASTGAVESDR